MKRYLSSVFFVILLVGWIMGCSTPPRQVDVLIVNGTVYDGTGRPGFQANVGVTGDKIVYVGKAENIIADHHIDAQGMAVSPGYIDLHTHAERRILALPFVENYIRQGVTTVVGGNCGGSPYPVGEFMGRVDSVGIAPNLALLVGHNTVRREVMGTENREATPEELEQMKSMVGKAMQEGAFGISTGLKYVPGAYASTDEVVALAKVVAEHEGFYATHLRDEGLEIIAAVEESIEIGRSADIPIQISHHKIVGKSMWGSSQKTLALIDEAVSEGMDVTYDQYPYTATSTGLTILFPRWALAGGEKAIKKRLVDPSERQKIKDAIIENIEKDRGGGDPANVVVASCRSDATLNGKNLAEITKLRGRRPTVANAAETLMDLVYAGGGSGIYHCLSEEDLVPIMRHKRGTVGSDGGNVAFGKGVVHPRNYGTFPRVLGRYVREMGVLSLEEAIHKMTRLPAERLGLKDRGIIKRGAKADVVLFNPETVMDHATFLEPHQYSTGILYVMVNGQWVIENGELTGAKPGKALRKHNE